MNIPAPPLWVMFVVILVLFIGLAVRGAQGW